MGLREIIARVKQATVALGLLDESNARNPFRIVGSGFCIHPRGIVVSNKHVFEAFMNKPFREHLAEIAPEERDKDLRPLRNLRGVVPYAIFFSMNVVPNQLVALLVLPEAGVATIDADLGMIKLSPHVAFPEDFPTLDIEEYCDLWEGMEVGVCGFPLGSFLRDQLGTITSSLTRGHLSSVIPYQGVPLEALKGFQLDVTATHGNSGGPVFSTETGRVLGVLTGGVVNLEGSLVPGFARAEPVYTIAKTQTINAMLDARPGEIPGIERP
jgi:S1-C subfamily serine protease